MSRSGELRSGLLDGVGHGDLVLLEGGLEHASQLVLSLVVGIGVLPYGVEELVRYTLNLLGNGQVEDGVGLVLGVLEGTAVDRVDDGTGVLQGTSSSTRREASLDPTGVDEVTVGVVLGHPLLEHRSVSRRVENQEGSTVTSREDGRRLGNTILGTGGLGGVTGDEVVVGLGGSKLGDGGQDSESVTAQHDDVVGLPVGDTGDLGVGDVLDGVGTSGVLGDRDIVVVGNSVGGVVDDVLEDRSVLDGTVDLGLPLGGQVDGLGVTSSLDVEDTGVGPDVLVVTDQETVGVGREGSLSSSRKTEEKGDFTLLSVGTGVGLVGTRVQGELAELDGLKVVHDREDTLLHFTGVLGLNKASEKRSVSSVVLASKQILPALTPKMIISLRLKLMETEVVEVIPVVNRLAGN
jgi:hypothetical protein